RHRGAAAVSTPDRKACFRHRGDGRTERQERSMNIQITAKPVTSEAALQAEYAAVRRRLFNPAVRPKPAASIEPPKSVSAVPRKKLVDFDEHVRMWRRWLASAGSPLKTYITARCDELGIPY